MSDDRTVPLTRPTFGSEEIEAVAGVLESGWVAQGPRVAEFELAVSDYVGAGFAIAMSSCTTALHASVVAMGIRPGDEVIVPALTWVATANVVEQVGATPVFADVRRETFNIDERAIEARVTERTVGILPVHLFGLASDLGAIETVAARHGLWVVEDAACGLGTTYNGVHVGTTGAIGCFSFHPRKSITTGEGGMAVTDDPRMAALLRSLRDHGSESAALGAKPAAARMPEFTRVGFNYRMTDIQGAIGTVQMRRLSGFVRERQRLAAMYDEGLRDLDGLVTPAVPEGFGHAYQSYVVMVDGPDADRRRIAMMTGLEDAGIGCRPGTHAPPFSAYYRTKYGYRPEDFPGAAAAEARSVALPLFPGMTDVEMARVIDVVRSSGVGL